MTGPEHYAEAEKLLEPGEYDLTADSDLVMRDTLRGIGHALLALAAAVGNNESSRGQTVDESNAWYRVAGTQPPGQDDPAARVRAAEVNR